MKKITKNGLQDVRKEEYDEVFDLVYTKHSKDFHFLTFDAQLSAGFSPVGNFIRDNETICKNEATIMQALLEKKEVCSLYPQENLTLYPLEKIEGYDYWVDLTNIDKHFEDILKVNDEYYKAKYLFVDFGHGAKNMDKNLILTKLNFLLSNSKFLEAIYIESM